MTEITDQEILKKYKKQWYKYNSLRRFKNKPELSFEEYVYKREHKHVATSEEKEQRQKEASKRWYAKHYKDNPEVIERRKNYFKNLSEEKKKEMYKKAYLKRKEKYHNMSEEEKKEERRKRNVRQRRCYENKSVEKKYQHYCNTMLKHGKEPSCSLEEYKERYSSSKHNKNWDDSFLNETFPFDDIPEEEKERRKRVLYRLQRKLREEGKDNSHLLELSRKKKRPPFTLREIKFLGTHQIFKTSLSKEEAKKRRKIYDYFRKRLQTIYRRNPTIEECYKFALTFYEQEINNPQTP